MKSQQLKELYEKLKSNQNVAWKSGTIPPNVGGQPQRWGKRSFPFLLTFRSVSFFVVFFSLFLFSFCLIRHLFPFSFFVCFSSLFSFSISFGLICFFPFPPFFHLLANKNYSWWKQPTLCIGFGHREDVKQAV